MTATSVPLKAREVKARRTGERAPIGVAVETRQIPLGMLRPAEWNANRVAPATLRKIRRSIERFGVVENLVARPHPDGEGFEVVSGNHRLGILAELGFQDAPVVVVDVDDAHARVLAQTLNRTRGEDDPKAYARLLEETLATMSVQEVAGFLPETPASIDRRLAALRFDPDDLPTPPAPEEPRSRVGEVYELGPHRLMCGDATDPAHVAELLAGAEPRMLLTDPPYGVELDGEWRDRAGANLLGRAEAAYMRQEGFRNTTMSGDTRADWADAYALVPSLEYGLVWHASTHAHHVANGLERVGWEIVQQIVWKKPTLVLSRQTYHWQHEPAFLTRKRGAKIPWLGGKRNQTTVWEVASPKQIMQRNALDQTVDGPVDHPSQKPLMVYQRPLENHLEPGDCFYEPFAGSGTAIVAAQMTATVCLAMELDPRYCDVIRARYDALVATAV